MGRQTTQYTSPDISWGQAVQRFVFSLRHLPIKVMIAGMVAASPVEAALELVPVVDVGEDIGIAGVLLRTMFVIYQIKKGKK